MAVRGGGSIVNVATMAAHFGFPEASAYGASNAANPEEIAEAIVFLASPRLSSINGAILPADGGRTAV